MTTLGDEAVKPRGRKSIPWHRDPVILERMAKVQRLTLHGKSNREIGRRLGVEEGTIRLDIARLKEQWTKQIDQDAVKLRAGIIAELEDNRTLSLEAAGTDELYTRAVLFGEAVPYTDVDEDGNETEKWLTVQYDDKGSAKFTGQKAQHLANARQASMDKAKVLGVIVDKVEHAGEIAARVYEYEIEPAPAALPEGSAEVEP